MDLTVAAEAEARLLALGSAGECRVVVHFGRAKRVGRVASRVQRPG